MTDRLRKAYAAIGSALHDGIISSEEASALIRWVAASYVSGLFERFFNEALSNVGKRNY